MINYNNTRLRVNYRSEFLYTFFLYFKSKSTKIDTEILTKYCAWAAVALIIITRSLHTYVVGI